MRKALKKGPIKREYIITIVQSVDKKRKTQLEGFCSKNGILASPDSRFKTIIREVAREDIRKARMITELQEREDWN